jgi:glycosyltransferase involved in cell wall biosynthesis
VWIAESLARQGFDVTVLTGIPNYPSGEVHDGYSPWRRVRERTAGFACLRVPLYPSHDRSAVRRISNYISFAASSSVWGIGLLRSVDAALVYSSPATAATSPMLSGTPFVLFIEDLWPDSVLATDLLNSGAVRTLAEVSLRWFTTQSYRRAHHVAVTSPGMRAALLQRGVPADKVSVVYNWVDETVMRRTAPDQDLRPRLRLTNEFLVMYAGNHGALQALDVVMRAMYELRHLHDVRLVMIGDGIEKSKLQSLARSLDLRSVAFLDRVQPNELPALMAAADLQLVCLADRDLFRMTIPSKVQSAMACGRPILSSVPGDVRDLIEAAGAGLTCRPGDPRALADAIRLAASMPRDRLSAMGQAGYLYYMATMSEAIGGRALADRLVRAAKSGTQGPVPGSV